MHLERLTRSKLSVCRLLKFVGPESMESSPQSQSNPFPALKSQCLCFPVGPTREDHLSAASRPPGHSVCTSLAGEAGSLSLSGGQRETAEEHEGTESTLRNCTGRVGEENEVNAFSAGGIGEVRRGLWRVRALAATVGARAGKPAGGGR